MAGLEHVGDPEINGVQHIRVEGLAHLLGIHVEKICASVEPGVMARLQCLTDIAMIAIS